MTPPKSNPMEDIFIHQIEGIVAKIFRGDTPADDLRTMLERHLEKARQLKLLRYEGETLNALGILSGDSQQSELAYYEDALACAQQADDPYLQVKLLNNIAASHRALFDYAQADRYLDQSISLGRALNPAAMAVLFSFAMRAEDFLLTGDFKTSVARVEEALELSQRVKVVGATRNDFGRGIYFLRVIGARAQMSLGHAEAARTSIELAGTLTDQLGIASQNGLNYRNRALYALLIDNDAAAYAEWWRKAEADYPITPGDCITFALMLHHTGHGDRARPLAEHALAAESTADPAVRQRVEYILSPVLQPSSG